jgi:hypothetical protein
MLPHSKARGLKHQSRHRVPHALQDLQQHRFETTSVIQCLVKTNVSTCWGPYPGRNNGKPILRKRVGRLVKPRLTSSPHAPQFQRWGSFCFPPQAKATPPTLKWGHGGFTPRVARRNSLKPVSRYFFPGMGPEMLKHLFFHRPRMTEVVSNRYRNAGLSTRETRPACVKAPPRSVAYATCPL